MDPHRIHLRVLANPVKMKAARSPYPIYLPYELVIQMLHNNQRVLRFCTQARQQLQRGATTEDQVNARQRDLFAQTHAQSAPSGAEAADAANQAISLSEGTAGAQFVGGRPGDTEGPGQYDNMGGGYPGAHPGPGGHGMYGGMPGDGVQGGYGGSAYESGAYGGGAYGKSAWRRIRRRLRVR